jgi:hypothetical protein
MLSLHPSRLRKSNRNVRSDQKRELVSKMSQDPKNPAPSAQEQVDKKPLSDAAKRALAEAEERRKLSEQEEGRPKEYNGPKGEEPTRFGDWERKGITYDF